MTIIRLILRLFFPKQSCPVTWANPKPWKALDRRLMAAHFETSRPRGALS